MQFEGEEREMNLALIDQLWPIFEARIPNDEAALAFLLKAMLVNSTLHCHCQISFENKRQKKNARVLICKVCKKEVWITASTIFNRVKLLKAWLGAIFLIGHGAVVTSNKLSTLAGTAISTALNIVRTVGLVVENERQYEIVDHSIKVPSMDFVAIFCRRSLLTLPRLHPSIAENPEEELEEEESNTEQAPDGERNTPEAEFAADGKSQLSPDELEILDLVTDEPITQDQICERTSLPAGFVAGTLVALEINGFIQSHDDGRFSKRKAICLKSKTENYKNTSKKGNQRKAQSGPAPMVEMTIRMTQSIRGGISRKYLQLYLSKMWCQLDRNRWSEDKLLRAFLRAPDICYQDIVDYESPAIVSLLAKS